MDRVTKSYVKDFLEMNEIRSVSDSMDFEKFCNYSIIKNCYNGTFEIETISTGSNAQGIDGIGIIVNGKLVNSTEEIDDLIAMNKFIEVSFIFIQAKISNSFHGTDIGNILFSVKNFFSDTPSILGTPEIKDQYTVAQKILDHFPIMTKGKPTLDIYFATNGEWANEASQNAVVNNGKEELKRLNYFSDIEFHPVSSTEVHTMYQKSKEKSNATFTFKDKITLSDIFGVEEAYFGVLPFSEFRNIILSENNTIKNIFYDNVRDYLGDNPVNESIEVTLRDKRFDIFTVLNNGVTIVASELNSSGNNFTITDYQVVNGCQTSHVLFENSNLDGIEDINIPIRLISTKDENVKNEITIATNNQTAVKPEQLEALSQYQKTLEEYYSTFEGESRLYYERRTNQYSSDSSVIKTKVVSIPQQIKTFAAMFLDLPHVVSGYYGTIMKNNGSRIFLKKHNPIVYYTSSLAYYKLDSYFRQNIFDSKYKKAKFHILMLYKQFASEKNLPQLNSRDIESYCKAIITSLESEEKSKELFLKCIDSIENELDIDDKYQFKQGDSTKKLLLSTRN